MLIIYKWILFKWYKTSGKNFDSSVNLVNISWVYLPEISVNFYTENKMVIIWHKSLDI